MKVKEWKTVCGYSEPLRQKRCACTPCILAWDSSNEASGAARLSIDLLKHAGWSIRSRGRDGADVAAYLARHGVRVQVDRIASGGRQANEILSQHALDVSADLIVMGAYNHPRWRQSLFGGTTRGMIEDSRMPVMLRID